MRLFLFAIIVVGLRLGAQSVPSTIHLGTIEYVTGRLRDPHILSTEPGAHHDPVWSPDGTLIAYVTQRPDADQPALVIRSALNGRTIRGVNVQLGTFYPLVWSDSYLYGTGWTKASGLGIYRVNAETGVAEAAYQEKGHIRVSKDGKNVYVGRPLQDGKEMVLIERAIASGKEREVMRREWFQGMALSPDNQHLITAGIDRVTNARTTLLVSLTTGDVRELQRVPSELSPSDLTNWTRGAKFWHAEWTPGSQSFLTLKRSVDEAQDDEVWDVPLQGEPRKLAFTLPRTTLTFRLQPGGTKIAWAIRMASTDAKQ